jgi:AcrR family transcriptional regulator
MSQTLRADAQENRDRVLDAARALFAEHGLDVTMRDIARRADVGPATLYRRFPTRRDLVDAAFADEMRTCRAIVVDACADPDPARGLRDAIERTIVLNAGNRGFVDAMASVEHDHEGIARHRVELRRMLAGLVDRARAAGDVRPDLTIDDVLLLLSAGRGIPGRSPARRAAAAHRFGRLAADMLVARAGAPAPVDAARGT